MQYEQQYRAMRQARLIAKAVLGTALVLFILAAAGSMVLTLITLD